MIARILALALLATRSEGTAGAAEHSPALQLDPCVQVDESVVQKLVELEVGDARASTPISVAVRCVDRGQEIRVEPWASRGDDGVRTIELPDAEDATATLEARSRELALAIAELIRRLEITRPLPAPPPPPPPPPPVVVAPIAPPEAPPSRWRLGALSSFEYFTGGQSLAGVDLSAAVSVVHGALAEVRVGGRLMNGEALPAGHLRARAATASLGGGANLWSRQRSVGFALMLRVQGYAVEYEAAPVADDGARTVMLGAVVVAVEPRLLVTITRRIAIAAGGAAGAPLHGIVVRTQGTQTDSMSGLVVSANLGLVVAL